MNRHNPLRWMSVLTLLTLILSACNPSQITPTPKPTDTPLPTPAPTLEHTPTSIATPSKRAMELGFIHGVTTNPVLIARTGKEARQVIAELGEICPGPIFHQVAAGSTEGMLAEAKAFSTLLP